jgi:sugar phosphate permease
MTSQSRYEWGLVALMFCVWGTLFLDRLNVLFVAPYLAPDLHISATQIGQLAGIIAVTWAISTLVFGVISDRIGRRRVLIPMIFAFKTLALDQCCALALPLPGFSAPRPHDSARLYPLSSRPPTRST